MLVALTSSEKALLFVLFLVLLPTVPVTIVLTRAMRRRKPEAASGELTRGRAASTPFRVISIVGSAIAVVAVAAVGVALIAQSIAGGGDGESVAPVENGGAGEPPTTALSSIPQQGNAENGRKLFERAGCGDCHTLLAAKATGTRGPSLDDDHPDFTRVVECVTTGPGDMPTFIGRLSSTEIRDVAKFVAVSDGSENTDNPSDNGSDNTPP
jgi:mono/diheme cytochrome c family protein